MGRSTERQCILILPHSCVASWLPYACAVLLSTTTKHKAAHANWACPCNVISLCPCKFVATPPVTVVFRSGSVSTQCRNQVWNMLLLSLAISGTLLLSVIAAAISGVARRRTGLRNVEVPRQSRLATTFCKMTPHHHTHCCPGHSGTSRTDRKTFRGPGFLFVRPVVWQRVSRGRTYHCLSVLYVHRRGAVGLERSLIGL